MHDPRLERFFAIDSFASSYPWNSPFAFNENRVIDGVELGGLEFYPARKSLMMAENDAGYKPDYKLYLSNLNTIKIKKFTNAYYLLFLPKTGPVAKIDVLTQSDIEFKT